jgi:hypothetical protein
MLFTIRIYYDLNNKYEYDIFFNSRVHEYLRIGYETVGNVRDYRQHSTNLRNNKGHEIFINGRPLTSTAITGLKADIIYVQNTALYKTNSEIINLFNQINPKDTDIYVFEKDKVIGAWNIS